MKVHCGMAGADCPKGLNICCGYCDEWGACPEGCTNDDYEDCSDAVAVNDELVQFQSAAPEVIQNITQLVVMKKQLEDQEKQLKQKLVEAMEAYGVKAFENDQIKMTYVAPTTRSTIDSIRLKKDHPDLAEQYTKTSNVSASVRITVK